MKRFFSTFILGPLLASIVAGTVFLVANLTASLISGSSLPVMNEPLTEMILKWLFLAGAFIAVGTPIGFLYAIIPNLIGNAVMHWIGTRTDAARAGGIWALVGALAAGVPAIVLAPVNNPYDGISTTIAFAITGGVCALICRRFTRWAEEAVA